MKILSVALTVLFAAAILSSIFVYRQGMNYLKAVQLAESRQHEKQAQVEKTHFWPQSKNN